VGRPKSRLFVVLSLLVALVPLAAAPAAAVTGDMIITGAVDGPLSGGLPKAIELYVVNNIADLSIYGVGSANNGGGSDGEEFTFPGVAASAGSFIYVASESIGFTSFFGFAPDYTSPAANINGDDALELFMNGGVVDVFGDINVDGTGQPWEHLDGWAYRANGTGADGTTFVIGNWSFSGPNALDGETTNSTAATPFPIGTYSAILPPPTILINEVDSDTPGSDAAEFVELYDGGVGSTALDGLVVVFYNGSDDQSYDSFDLDGFSTDADGYFVLGNAGVSGVDLVFAGNGLQNGADAVALYTGDATDFPNDTPLTTTDLLDAIVYDTNDSDDAALLVLLNAAQPQVNEDGNGDKDNHSNQRCLNGTGGARNTDTYDQFAPTPGTDNSCGAEPPAELIINEIMQNPNAVFDSNGEWFEIHNPGIDGVDIDGWVISDSDFDSHIINNGGPLTVPAGGYLVLGINDDSATNGGLTVDYEYSGITLANGADELILTDGSDEIDRVEWDGGPNFPDPTGASMSLIDAVLDNSVGANWCEASTSFGDGDSGTPGTANDCLWLIHEIQGSGPIVAISGPVAVEAIVTSLLENNDALDGFLLQEEDTDADADPATSEGIRIECGATCPTGLAVGDLVTVVGSAGEDFGMSEINANSGRVTIESSGNALPTATLLELPAPAGTDEELTFEPLEGMLVQFIDELFVSEYFELARFGQVVLTVDERPFQFTHTNSPNTPGYMAFLEDLATRRIVLDDDNNNQNAATSGPTADTPYFWELPGFSTTNFFRGGDSITDLTGGLDWAFGEWRVKHSSEVLFDYSFTPNESRTTAPEPVGGTLQVASFNVLNYFTTLDTGPSICGPSGNLGCRGANSTAELDRQRDKIVSALVSMDADVVGLVEIENNAAASLDDLVGGLNAVVGAGTYDYIDTGTIGTDAIKVALIYKPATVAPFGNFAILDSSVDPRFIDTKNRPVLIQTFEEIASAARVTVAVNHLKSKGSACDDVGDPDLGDGQANCNSTRTDAVEALVDYLETDPTGSGDSDFLIMGDLNAYAMEDPITAAEGAGYTNLIEAFHGADTYSFVFDGQLGYLDHAMSNEALTPQVTGVTEWHINSDEVNVLDYNDGIQDPGEASFERKSNALPVYDPDPYRSSDHDPVIIGLALDTPRSLKQQVLDGLEALPDPEDQTIGMQVKKAIDSIEDSLDPNSWETGAIINTKKVFDQERRAVVQLMLVVASGGPEADAAQVAIDTLVEADRQLALVELAAAIARGGSPSKIADAQAAMTEAAALNGAGIYNEAINAYKAAWDAATKA
jgi:hypothetical protein